DTVGEALKVPFAAEHQDQPVEVLAVLQRTAIVHPAGAAVWDQRGMVRLTALLVDPERLEWVYQISPAEFRRRRKAAFSIRQRKSRGEAGQRRGHRRARADRERASARGKPEYGGLSPRHERGGCLQAGFAID